MPRKPARQHRTALGSFIEQWRRDRGLTQAQFQQSLGVELGDRYVSKVESGQIRRPNRELFEALSELTGVAVEELRRRAGEPAVAEVPVSSSREPRVLFGHCLWGVPVLLAAARGFLKGFKVASLKPDQGNEKWIEPDQDPTYLRGLAQEARPMNAADVVFAMLHKNAEIGIIPGDVARRHQDVLERVGVVFDGSAGMVLLSPVEQIEKILQKSVATPDGQASTRKGTSGEKPVEVEGKNAGPGKGDPRAQARPREPVPGSITTREIGHGLCRLSTGRVREQPFVGLDEATVSRDVFRDIERAGREAARDSRSHVDFDALRWHVRTAALTPWRKWLPLQEVLREDHPHPHANLFGLITWEPLATWIENAEGNGLARLQILALHGLAEWPRHFTFEVVIRKSDAQDSALVGHLNDLMSGLWNVTAGPLSAPDGDLDADTLDAITAYFALGESRAKVKETLSSYRYVTYWHEGPRNMLAGRRPPS